MNKPLIFLDAGHGINTAGKRSPIFTKNNDYVAEYELNIPIVLMLYKLLRDNNYDVDFSTTDIMDTDLINRYDYMYKKALANIIKYNPILISIHSNAFGDGKLFNDAYGIETLYNPNKPYDEKLANIVHTEVIKNIENAKNRGLKKRSNLKLLKIPNIPSCMIEIGFMTNKYDLNKLLSYEYKLDLAHAIFNGIVKYYE